MQQIRDAITTALNELELPSVDFSLEHPADVTHGDYASNVAMVLAKQVGEAPRAVAEKIVAQLEGKIDIVTAISLAGPGFINFTLARDFFTATTKHITEVGVAWGQHETWAGKKVLVEYTDPNPFKEFHIGHLFTNTVGESIARLFDIAGADTKRCNYQGDVGMHVAMTLWGMHELGLTPESELTPAELGKAYAHGATAYKGGDEAVVAEVKRINKAVYERSDESINQLYDAGRQVSLDYFETIYSLVGTKFDHYFFESEAGPKGREVVVAHPDVFTESDGALVFPGENYGLHTRVFVNSEGLPTYEAKELALAKMKEDATGGYDHSVISTANEITEYFKVLLCAMGKTYPELAAKTEHIGHGTVRLSSGKMSSRTGDVIRALDFVEDIAEAAKAKMIETGSEANVEVATQERAPHHVARYLTDLAGAFNTFYAQEKIADATDEFAPYKAALAQAVEQTLQNGLWVLGIEAPERM
jgi:arginyl-tRNA synthetase